MSSWRGPDEDLIGVPGSRAALTTPALVLDLDALEANISSMAAHARAHGVALRPGGKVHKSVDIARLQIPVLTVRTTVIHAAQAGFVVTDAGYKELDLLHGLSPVVLRGAPPTAAYSIVGDDMGRIDLPPNSGPLRVGAAVEVLPAHCWLTVPSFARYHVVRGDDLVDIWPVMARDDR